MNRASPLAIILVCMLITLFLSVANLLNPNTASSPPELPLPPSGPGGPLLIVRSIKNPSSSYYEEIIKAEGLNEFRAMDITDLDMSAMQESTLILLAEMSLTQHQVTLLTDWVTNGGLLIAMRPDKKLSPLLGLDSLQESISNGYLLMNASEKPSAGLVKETIQFHGTADGYHTSDNSTLATLYESATKATSYPAVTLRKVGSKGGQAATFTYDLAKSVIATRQGNKEWAGEMRDGMPPHVMRPDDLFYPDFVDLDKVAIPQADEQQRLLANLIILMTLDKQPLPRFWYLPNGKKVVILHALDDHNNVGTATKETFDKLKEKSPKNSSPEDWESYRATSWFFLGIPLTDNEAKAYHSEGFEMGVHVNTGCKDWTPASLNRDFENDLSKFHEAYPSLPKQKTNRTHCIVWDDWASAPKIELKHGIHLDLNYYYWPDEWIKNRPGFFTGSGIPMPYTDEYGSTINVYQAATQLVNGNGLKYPEAILKMIDNALGPEGYYGVLATHDDYMIPHFLDHVIYSAKSRGVSIVSAEQVLRWFEGKNSSSFNSLTWKDNVLSFEINIGAGAHLLQVMLPTHSDKGTLSEINNKGVSVKYTTETIKGISYCIFFASDGVFEIIYKPT